MVEPPVTVSRSLCSAASRFASYESLFTATELSALKPWLARQERQWVRVSVQLQFVVGRFSLHCDGAERSETVVFLVSLTIFLLPRQS